MGRKAGFLTPKAIGNRIKAKGLGRLRWYCELCEKQCRDANGYKCHTQSEAHLRKLQLFNGNRNTNLDNQTKKFETAFLGELSRRHHTNKVKANQFYTDYISDKTHLHMNSTRYTSLTQFIKEMGRQGRLWVEFEDLPDMTGPVPGVWWVRYIDRNEVGKMEVQQKREKMALDDAERDRLFSERQRLAGGDVQLDIPEATELDRTRAADLSFGLQSSGSDAPPAKQRKTGISFSMDEGVNSSKKRRQQKPTSAMADIVSRETAARQKKKSRPEPESFADHWLMERMVCKCINKSVGDGEYYKKKGVVKKVTSSGRVAEIRMFGSGDVLKLSCDQLETVIPLPGKPVVVCDGEFRGAIGNVSTINVESFSVDVELKDGRSVRLPYESVSKVKP